MFINTQMARKADGLKVFMYEFGSFWFKIKERKDIKNKYFISSTNVVELDNVYGKTIKALVNKANTLIL